MTFRVHCPRCHETYVAHGATEAIALRAFIAWPGCGCGGRR